MFQTFSKFNATVQENVGLGYVEELTEDQAVSAALQLAAADELVASLPQGLGTTLDNPGFESISYPGMNYRRHSQNNGLSGGEVRLYPLLPLCKIKFILRQWQRIAIARAFMRANQPEVDLLLFDEPVCILTAYNFFMKPHPPENRHLLLIPWPRTKFSIQSRRFQDLLLERGSRR